MKLYIYIYYNYSKFPMENIKKICVEGNMNAPKSNSYDFQQAELSGPSSESSKSNELIQEAQEADSQDSNNETPTDFASIVASHYNKSLKSNLKVRNISPIFYLRNFNNWIKNILIRDCVSIVFEKKSRQEGLQVLDMCCGKGGDLLKWIKNGASHIICADIAEKSLEEYESRYKDYIQNSKVTRNCLTQCHFISADCTRVRLKEKYQSFVKELDIVSCQFSFHYCFESLPQAECMLKNASECLKPGGLFIGTIPNANEIVKRVRESKTKNEVFSIKMCCSEPYPLFGAKYNFYLEGVVNCPEFLVYFPVFKKLALKYGLKFLKKENFGEFFEKKKSTQVGKYMLRRMHAMEIFSKSDNKLKHSEYAHARLACELSNSSQVGTLSKSEWEVISLYQSFVFQKE